MTDQPARPFGGEGGFARDLPGPRIPASAGGELTWESTVTAPTEWVPYAYTTGELRAVSARRASSVASLVFGAIGLVLALFGVWGAPLSLVAVVLALVGWRREPMARALWGSGLATGIVALVITAGWLIAIANASAS